jgi:hypothetical protein
MFRRVLTINARRVAAVLIPGIVALATLGVGSAPASATITIGPHGAGNMGGSAYCNMANHTIGFAYNVTPEFTINEGGLRSVTSSMSPTPEWVEVYAYAKLSSSTTWGAPVAHGYSYVDHNMNVLASTVRAYAGQRYDVGFLARAAYPGGQWTNWLWDPASIYTSYSGSIFAAYPSCLT